MSRRYFVDSEITGETAHLVGQEAQHLSKVMRAQIGDELILFDGTGAEFIARAEKITRSEVQLAIIERHETDRELSFRLCLGVALPKGDRQRWLVEKLVELGVTELVPLITDRSVAQPSGNAMERLRRAVIEASKQCGRNRLMRIGEARCFTDFVTDNSNADLRLIAHPPDAADASRPWNVRAQHIALAIGPEGGFTSDELTNSADHEWQAISLGTRILRTETAAVAIASMFALGNEP